MSYDGHGARWEGERVMRRSVPILVVMVSAMLAACGATPGASPSGGTTATTNPADTAQPGGESTEPGGATPAGQATEPPAGGVTLPAACAEGLAEYLVAIEPDVSGFDPASGTLADYVAADQASNQTSYELLEANNSTATYSCSEVGLQWAYFDAQSPWDAVLAVAAEAAPGTVAYLGAVRTLASHDVEPMSTYGFTDCDAAVTSIKDRVAAQVAGGTTDLADMPYEDGVALLGLYKAYSSEVRNDVCPRDELGNDEWEFMGALG